MRRTEVRQGGGKSRSFITLGLGALLALGVEMMVLLMGSFAVSVGVLRADTEMQLTAAACLIGCFIGASFACTYWDSHRLLCGLLTGLSCFALILLVAMISADEFKIGVQGLVELAGCMIGGGLAGFVCVKKKRKKRKNR